MRAPESPFERYLSERILSFALMCPSVSGPKALKTCLRFTIFNFSEKLQNIFEIGFKNMECSYKNRSQTNSIWHLAFYSVRFKWKNWFEKTGLNMSIRRVIFTSGQNLKRPFRSSLPIFNIFQWFLFYISDLIWIITLNEKSKYEENCQSEGIL